MQQAVITGMGIVSSLGAGVDTLQSAMQTGTTKFTRTDYPMLSFPVIWAPITDFSFDDNLQRFAYLNEKQRSRLIKITRHTTIIKKTALIAMLEAWQQAGLDKFPVHDATRFGLIAGAQNTSSNYQYELYSAFNKSPRHLPASYALQYLDTDYIGLLSDAFGIQGEGYTVGGAMASGNIALIRACQMIRNKEQDVCAVLGPAAELSPMDLQVFHSIKAMGGRHYNNEPGKACRPFDQNHEGFIYGQASACIILESLESATTRGVPILGCMLGGAVVLGADCSAKPDLNSELRAMREALKESGLDIARLDYINAHGTSSPLGDVTELVAIQSLLGSRCPDVYVNSTKSITGHCFWSAGIVEAIATIIQMQNNFVHPNINLDNPISNTCRLVRSKCEKAAIQTGLSNSFGFGGINTAIVLAKTI